MFDVSGYFALGAALTGFAIIPLVDLGVWPWLWHRPSRVLVGIPRYDRAIR